MLSAFARICHAQALKGLCRPCGFNGEHGIYVAIYLTEINVAAVAAAGGDVPQ